MNRHDALKLVKPHLTEERYAHTERVTDTAIRLAKIYDESEEAVMLAAVFHDYAKYRDQKEMKKIIADSDLPNDLLAYHHELWHGPVASLLISKEFGIDNPDIISAIRWHTTGTINMQPIDKIIYLADYIEPGRDFPGLDQVRQFSTNNLDYACFLAVRNSICFLLNKERLIYPDTLFMYNDLNQKLGDHKNG